MGSRYEHYMQIIHDRDTAMLVLAGLVLSAILWYGLLDRWPRLRRWLAWGAVVVYVAAMAAFVLIGVPAGVTP